MSSCCCRPLPATGLAQDMLGSGFLLAWQIFYMLHEVLSQALAAYETPCHHEQSSPWQIPMVSFPQLSFTCKGSGIIPAFYCLSSHDDLIDEDHFEEISSVRSLLPLESPFCGPSAQISRTKKCILYVHLRDKQNFNFPSACLRIPYGLLAGLRKKIIHF